MSRFRVDWEPTAESQLADIWLKSSDPNEITAATARADQLLANDPFGEGRHLSEGLYVLDVSPLILNYTVDDKRMVVAVTWIRVES